MTPAQPQQKKNTGRCNEGSMARHGAAEELRPSSQSPYDNIDLQVTEITKNLEFE